MSAYENVVGGKLKLKGKALDVKAGGVKKKKKNKHQYDQGSQIGGDELPAGGNSGLPSDPSGETIETENLGEERQPRAHEVHLTPAEKRYIEQRDKINVHRHAKISNKSHRDRIQDFNQYLANLSEHYVFLKLVLANSSHNPRWEAEWFSFPLSPKMVCKGGDVALSPLLLLNL